MAHDHTPKDFGSAFLIGIVLNTVFVVAEAAFGLWSGSLALVADAGHNLSDVLGLAMAWLAAELMKKSATTNVSARGNWMNLIRKPRVGTSGPLVRVFQGSGRAKPLIPTTVRLTV